MTCDEIDELLAPYSLTALSSEETATVRQHLATCRRHDTALAEYQAVASRLPLAVPEQEAPPELRTRILATFDAEKRAQVSPQPLKTVAASPRWWVASNRLVFAYAAAAALLLVAVGLTAWNIALQVGEGGSQTRVVRELSGEVGNGQFIYLEDEAVAIFEMDLEEPPSDRVYQAWGIYEAGPVSLGLLPNEGVAAFSADLKDASAVAISIEPEGGSAQPTTDPLLVATLH